MVKTVATVCSEIYDEVRKLAPEVKRDGVSLRVNPEVARALGGEEASVLKDLSSLLGHDIRVQADPLLHQEQFDVVPQ
jgi:ribonuclease G